MGIHNNKYEIALSMKFSVITPVFNGERFIRGCIESVLNQSYADKEYIVVDGASTDKTVDIVKEYPLTWISEKDRGLYDAFNKGINISTGEIVCFLCADDMYAHTNVLQLAADTFASNPGADIVYGDIVYVDIDSSGKSLAAEAIFGTVEAVKTVSDLFLPVNGTITEINPKLNANPELVNNDPYGDGWMVKMKVANPADLDGLMTSEAYQGLTA